MPNQLRGAGRDSPRPILMTDEPPEDAIDVPPSNPSNRRGGRPSGGTRNMPPPPPTTPVAQDKKFVIQRAAETVLSQIWSPEIANGPITPAELALIDLARTERHVSWWWANRYERARFYPDSSSTHATHVFNCLDGQDFRAEAWTYKSHFQGSVLVPDDKRPLLHAMLYANSRIEPRVNCIAKATDKYSRIFLDLDACGRSMDAARDGSVLKLCRHIAMSYKCNVHLAQCTTKINSFHITLDAVATHSELIEIGKEFERLVPVFQHGTHPLFKADTSVYIGRNLRVLFCRDVKVATKRAYKRPVAIVLSDGTIVNAIKAQWTVGRWMYSFDCSVPDCGRIINRYGVVE